MKPVAWLRTAGTGSPVVTNEFIHTFPEHGIYFSEPLYTADQLREAKVEALREAAEWFDERVFDYPEEELRRMADELEKQK